MDGWMDELFFVVRLALMSRYIAYGIISYISTKAVFSTLQDMHLDK